MKLEFIRNINEFKEHAIRLSDFNTSEALLFRDQIRLLISNAEQPIDLTSSDFIQSVNCHLILRTAVEDTGIDTADGKHFFCDLTVPTYKTMVDLLEPFCRKESKGYRWLYDIDTPIGFLFSSGKDIPDGE
jgi:hypothetical protein